MAIPAAALFTLEASIFIFAGLDLDNHTVPFVAQVRAAVFLASWAAVIYWAAWETDSGRRTFSRTCWAFSTAGFLLPIALIAWAATSPPYPEGNLFSKSSVVVIVSFLGVVLGIVGILLATAASPPEAPERYPRQLLRDFRATLRRIGEARIAAALMLLVAAVVVLHIGSTAGLWSEKYTEITTHVGHTCGIRTDGTAHCWGQYRETPPQDERFVSIAPGRGHACGLREDGSLYCWGRIDIFGGPYVSADPGSGISEGPFTEITAGGNHICGLRLDGTVVCWGDGRKGETSPPEGERFTEVSAGHNHTCGIRPDGTGVCWGSIDSPPGSMRFKTISSGLDYACGIRVEEDITCWGPRGSLPGQPSKDERFVALDIAADHACGLRPDGSVNCWGSTIAYENHNFGSEPVSGDRFVSISSGSHYNCGLRENGTVKCWGGIWLDRLYR